MALLFCDSCDHYSTWSDKYEATIGVGTAVMTSAAARSGSQGINVAGVAVRKNLATNYTTLIAGAAFRYLAGFPPPRQNGLIGFCDNGTIQTGLYVTGNGYITAQRNTTALGVSSVSITPLMGWHYIELSVLFATGATGTVTVRLDGQVVMTVSGVQTAQTANAFANQVFYGDPYQPGFGFGFYIDDFYCLDTSGSLAATTTFLGDIKVVQSPPTGQGTVAWTIGGSSPAATNWQSTITEDIDVTYVSSATVGQRDHYTFPAISLTGTIFGVIVWCQARKDDAGVRQIAVTCTSAGSDLIGATQTLLGGAAPGNYGYYPQVFQTDPHGSTSVAWTLSALNAADFGIDEIA